MKCSSYSCWNPKELAHEGLRTIMNPRVPDEKDNILLSLRDSHGPEMAKASKSLNLLAFKMVGVTGIEPVTPTMST